MTIRFRKRVRLFPGVALNFSKYGLSSLSLGPRGATINVPLGRDGGTRVTAGLPGTGLSYTEELGTSARQPRSTSQRRQAQRPAPKLPTTEAIITDTMAALAGPEHVGDALWRQGLAQRVLDHEDTPRNVREAALLIKSPESAELHMRRAKGVGPTTRASLDIVRAVETVVGWAEEQGMAEVAND